MLARVMDVICDIPGNTIVAPGQGNRARAEMWLLINPQLSFDWNYWILLTQVLPRGNWLVRDVVPWWGRCEWTDTHNINTAPTADDDTE